MLTSKNPVKTKAWAELLKQYRSVKDLQIKNFFKEDRDRFEKFHIVFEDIVFDYSKNFINEQIKSTFIQLCDEISLKDSIEKMFSGDMINQTEKRAVLHTALRNRSSVPVFVEGKDVMPDVNRVLEKMKEFSTKVITGALKGSTGKKFTDVVNIGIGGSDLGPAMVTRALTPFHIPDIKVHFVSNIDGSHIVDTLNGLNPETTLFIIASKTFTTLETMTNALYARSWISDVLGQDAVYYHFAAVSTNIDKVKKFGINPENVFGFWDWVGGRYSLWSAIGLPIAIAVGFDRFSELLEGAYAMDMHFKNSAFDKNIPVLMALLGIWYNNFFKAETHAVLPYSQHLERFPAFLQQLDMESNGKSVDREGDKITYQTGPVIWGEPGTNGQHAFFQLLHQGTKMVPCDFIAGANSIYKEEDHQRKLIANFLAQTEALMNGKTAEEVREELERAGMGRDEIEVLLPYKVFEGNRPTNTILFRELNPRTLGSLIAMYEHKVFVQGVILNVFSFDQWGVELGKSLAKTILKDLEGEEISGNHDSSTLNLIKIWREMNSG